MTYDDDDGLDDDLNEFFEVPWHVRARIQIAQICRWEGMTKAQTNALLLTLPTNDDALPKEKPVREPPRPVTVAALRERAESEASRIRMEIAALEMMEEAAALAKSIRKDT